MLDVAPLAVSVMPQPLRVFTPSAQKKLSTSADSGAPPLTIHVGSLKGGSALNFVGADELFQVLSYTQLTGLIPPADGDSVRGDYTGTYPGVVRPRFRWETVYEADETSHTANSQACQESTTP